MRFRRIACATVAVVSCIGAPARAQDTVPPAHFAFVDGSTSLVDREGQTLPAAAGMPFVEGDRLRTTAGRVEVLFADGTALDLDHDSTVELQSSTLLRLTAGRMLLIVAGAGAPASAVRYQVDTPVASVHTDGPGEFRVAIFAGAAVVETELAVLRGYAALTTERGSVPVAAGERSVARDLDRPGRPLPFNSARFDAFDRWSADRRDARLAPAASTQYLPSNLQMYGAALDRYGSWGYDAQAGGVWYPSVAPDWRPYFHGYWSAFRPYGWTWVGLDVWSWPTHHYGRWGHAHGRWFWKPDRHWGPAWVSWAAAPGYVGWSALGWNNGPVFGLSVNVNIGGPHHSGWVVVPRQHFGGSAVNVRNYAVPSHRLPAATPFVVHNAPPVAPRAAARGGASVLRPGRAVAVPRTAGAPAGLSQAARLPAARAARTGRPSPAYTPPLGDLARADRSRPVAVRRNPEVTPRAAPPDEATRLQPRSTISGARSRADQWGSAPRGLSAIPRQPAGPAERQFSVPPRNQFSVPPQPGFSTASRPPSVSRREYSAPPAGQPPPRSAPSAAPRSAPRQYSSPPAAGSVYSTAPRQQAAPPAGTAPRGPSAVPRSAPGGDSTPRSAPSGGSSSRGGAVGRARPRN